MLGPASEPLSGIGGGRYRLTKPFLLFEKGTLSTKAQQISTHEIHDVDAKQSMSQKARGVGNITIHAARVGGNEVVVLEDVPDFRDDVRLLTASLDWRAYRRRDGCVQTPSSAGPSVQLSLEEAWAVDEFA